jgi:translation initiation factor 1A
MAEDEESSEEETDKESNEENSEESNGEEVHVTRAKIPRGEEVIGIIEERLGGNKMKVNCLDGKTRNSRVPGRLKRKLWLRPGDVVLVEPWELDKDKGDVIFKYPSNQIEWLKRNGYIKTEKKEF